MTSTISVLLFIGLVFAGFCALRLLLRGALILVYFAADLAAPTAPKAAGPERRAHRLDLNLPALG